MAVVYLNFKWLAEQYIILRKKNRVGRRYIYYTSEKTNKLDKI